MKESSLESRIERVMKEKIIVKLMFGSHLYGTADSNSDKDYKGIFMPTKEQIFLGKIPKSYNTTSKEGNTAKNTSEDVDSEFYSLHYFIELACQGQTVALDMLHAPDNMILELCPIWKELVNSREKFYTKNLSAFVGYARRQAAKYGIKGSRLNACSEVLATLIKHEDEIQLKDIWDKLPKGEHLHFLDELTPNSLRQYQVVGKKFQETVRVGYVFNILNKFYEEYGKRAQLAAENKGIDWKAVSHALRAAYQTKQILTENTITFPLKEAPYLTEIKQGKRDYLTKVVPELESLMNEIEELSMVSMLPEKVDRNYWDRWLTNTVEEELF